MKKRRPCAHISVFSRAIFYEEKSRSLHCALFIITTFFFTFQKEERERERLIFVERTTLIIIKAHDARAHKTTKRGIHKMFSSPFKSWNRQRTQQEDSEMRKDGEKLFEESNNTNNTNNNNNAVTYKARLMTFFGRRKKKTTTTVPPKKNEKDDNNGKASRGGEQRQRERRGW